MGKRKVLINNNRKLNYVFFPLGSQTTQPLLRVFPYSLDHDYQIPPFHLVAACRGIIGRDLESSSLKTLCIEYHAAILRMDELHKIAVPADEDEDISVLDFLTHAVVYYAAQGADTLAHIGLTRT